MDKRNNINFLYHYKGVGRRIKLNKKLSATSVALYHALLYFWNESIFSEPLMIERNEILSYSKLSEETYYKNLDLLRSEGLLDFIPGLHGKKLIKIFMIRFDLDWTSEKSRAYHPKIVQSLYQNTISYHPKISISQPQKPGHLINIKQQIQKT